MNMTPNGITMRGLDLTRTFGSGTMMTVALRQVSLDLRRGEFALLMGPSGSGKSTLLAVLSGLLRPTQGQVLVQGKDLWALSEREQEQFRLEHFGFIFQGCNLFPALTARQQLEIVLQWGQGAPARESRGRASAMLEMLGLGNKLHLRPRQLSGGEQQRVAIGRALVKEPAFCFADEPTSALDSTHGGAVVQLLRAAAHERGASVLAVSHDPRIVPHADRVFYLEDGSLVERPPAAERGDQVLCLPTGSPDGLESVSPPALRKVS
jgi:putative ABC transport system ATP-binding protein